MCQWQEVASEYEPGLRGQQVTPIIGPVGWLKYLSKHAARGVRHYQRQGKPVGWDKTGRLWGFGGDWPWVEPMRLQLTTDQAWRLRRLVRRYAIAQARAAALGYERSGRTGKAAAAWDSVSWGDGVSALDGLAFARLFRSTCTVCGSGRLTWGSVGDEVGRLVAGGEDADPGVVCSVLGFADN